jgi:Cu2+-exporting ATPase
MSTLRNELNLGRNARPEKDEHSHHHQNHDHHSESDSSAAGFDKHAGHHFGFSKDSGLHWYFLSGLLLSHMIQQWLGFTIAFQGDKYVLLVLGSIIYFYGGMPFFKGFLAK